MSNFIRSFITGFNNYATRIGKARVRRELLARDDRFLTDTGFSRELLQQGIDAWPWRLHNAEQQNAAVVVPMQDYKKAVTELNAYSDAELKDLGVARANIKEAVRYGRPGIEQDRQKAA